MKTGHEIDFVLDSDLAIEAKETPLEADLTPLTRLAKTAGISRTRLVGRHRSPKFTDYAWAGSII